MTPQETISHKAIKNKTPKKHLNRQAAKKKDKCEAVPHPYTVHYPLHPQTNGRVQPPTRVLE